MKKILPILLLIIQLPCANAQTPSWIRSYMLPGKSNDTYITQMQTIKGPNHSVYVSAEIQQSGIVTFGGTQSDVVLKYSENGTLEWMRSTDSIVMFGSGLIAVDKVGSVYQSGIKRDSAIWNSYITKYSSDGNFEWNHITHNPNKRATGNQVITMDSGQVILLTCWQYVFSVTKFSSIGDLVWNYVDSSTDNGMSAILNIDQNGNVLVCANPGNNTLLLKLDRDGNRVWRKTMTVNQEMFLTQSIQTDMNNCIYLLSNPDNLDGNCTVLATKLDPNGKLIWQKELINNSRCNAVGGMVMDEMANLYIASSLHPNSGYKDSIVYFKMDSSGQILQTNYYSGINTFDDLHAGITIDKDHNCYIYGQSNAYSGIVESLLLKWNQDGVLIDSIHHNFLNLSNETIYSLAIDPSGEMIVSGIAKDSIQSGIFTMGFAKNTGLERENITESNLLIYPNPAQNEIRLQSNQHTQFKKAMIYDALGKLISQPSISSMNTIDISGLCDGIYQCIGYDKEGQSYSSKLVVMH